MKKIMAVYDEDPFYAERLSDYINRRICSTFRNLDTISWITSMDYSVIAHINCYMTAVTNNVTRFCFA